ncbi:hypothetical protein [Methylobacterium dankookense]|uniref:Uncharacterized protein n=1 Tax=Methylobacterium dankookense TaxID=560405 RepID=A0A564G724_9HYPH|nr:hypothetical protein [Methylobacterium dankookense]GJD59034.1 hypothetical protein IFDJLNFL_4960 [Methylobacterium dankookense]VUF15872.1 hypothetical protein MTDSW087_05620 [Methylobacterium dankookense]
MPRKRFTNEHIALALRQAENGATVDEVSRYRRATPPPGPRPAIYHDWMHGGVLTDILAALAEEADL